MLSSQYSYQGVIMELARQHQIARLIVPLLAVMILFSALFYLLVWHKSRQEILLEYQQVFVSTYALLTEEANIANLPDGTGALSLDGRQMAFYRGDPTPNTMLDAMGIPAGGFNDYRSANPSCDDLTRANQVCFVPLADNMTLAISGVDDTAHIVIFPNEMKDNAWWQTCMLIYAQTKATAQASAKFDTLIFDKGC
ncbi:hypothetical protein [Shewanella sp. NIFS-20-20]|uniref:hypothetical protein n=1 Tax=Shewanella sp. NIFS-20-20 TaxID=2853806 RepID=UPI001C4833E8|nr:hypothetical protein [Shewanella sp. NIFS-20-20]MBV7316351.1 hypothetical protein [Shewanella sp. NIFS-20-20]